MNSGPISFPDWHQALGAAALDERQREEMRREILGFLRYCKTRHTAATAEIIRQYLEAKGPSSRAALRWFYSKGRLLPEAGASPPVSALADRRGTTIPPLAADDLGATGWEQALIKASRERGFLWRTEQTYREWARRFAAFLAPRLPFAATGEDVAAFLSDLAVRFRASPSSQKQALNALVFLMQEALHRDLGEMDFQRARPKRGLPTVLSLAECRLLFAQAEGTPRLMMELAYGSGLRLLELLRLRVHHVDLDRQRLQVFAGKGDKDRVTVLPESLVPALREHLQRLRPQWEADRAAGLAGVWLPEGLARKYPKAGERWEWQWLFPARRPAADPRSGIVRRHHVVDMTSQRLVRRSA